MDIEKSRSVVAVISFVAGIKVTGDAIGDGTHSVQWNAGNSPEIVRVNSARRETMGMWDH